MHIKTKITPILDKIIELGFYVLTIAITFSTGFVNVSVAVIIFCWLVKKILEKNFEFSKKNWFLVIFGIFIFWNLLSFLNSNYLNESTRGLIKVIKYGFVLFISIDVFKNIRILKNIVYILIGWSLVIALNGVAQSWLGFDLIRLRTINSIEYPTRLSSSFRHPNDFGAYMVLVIPVFLSYIFSKNTLLSKRLYFIIGIALLSFCLIKTYSRGAWLALSMAVLLLGFFKGKKLYIIFLSFIILFLFLLPQLRARSFDLFNFKYGSTSWERVKLWNGGINMIKQHPFLGFGVNTYTRNFPAFKPNDYPDVIYPHNCYMQMASEIGITGVSLFLIFVSFALFYIGSSIKALPKNWIRSTVIGLFAGLIGFLLHSAVDTHLYSVNLAVMFYYLLGFCIALCNYARNNPA